MSSGNPALLLIPGGFSLPEFYDAVVNPLVARGVSIRALHLPSMGYAQTIPCSMHDDATFIASEVSKLVDEGKDVILISHSYGGVPATQSTSGLGKLERQRQAKQGGIVRLAYATSPVPPSASLECPPNENMVELRLDDDGWLHQSDIPLTARICFSDLPQEEGEAWARKLTRQSSNCSMSDLSHAGYLDIPVSYLLCENDICVPPAQQKAGIAMIERQSGKKVEVTSIKADHCPFISKPKEVIDWILDVIAKS